MVVLFFAIILFMIIYGRRVICGTKSWGHTLCPNEPRRAEKFWVIIILGDKNMTHASALLNGFFIGFIAGIFALWWWFSADIMYFSVSLKKSVPDWMISVAQRHPFIVYFYEEVYYKPYYQTVLRILTIVYVLVFIVFSLYYPIIGAPLSINIMNKSAFDMGLLATWLLPSFFLRRYLRKITTREKIPEERSTKGESSPSQRKRVGMSFVLLVIAMTALFVFVSRDQPLISPATILGISSLLILCYFAVLINLRIRRKNRTESKKRYDSRQ